MADSFYSFSEPFNRGIDFYQADAADVTIDINSSVIHKYFLYVLLFIISAKFLFVKLDHVFKFISLKIIIFVY